MALDDMSVGDHQGDGTARVDRSHRPNSEPPDEARCVPLGGSEWLHWMIEHPVADVEVIRVTGELDLLTTPLLKTRLLESIATGPGHLVVDLGGITFIGAAGLSCLVTAQQTATRQGVQLHLTGTDHRAVARPMEITRLRPSFNIHPTVESVVNHFRRRASTRTVAAVMSTSRVAVVHTVRRAGNDRRR